MGPAFPARNRAPVSCGLLAPLLAAGLVVPGAGAFLLSVAAANTVTGRLLGGNYAVNEGSTNPLDISAHNSPTVVQNPIDPDNLAASNRIDSPLFSCALQCLLLPSGPVTA